jgi:uncharacterized OB-fold protein
MSSLPAPSPPVTLETQPFWDAAGEGRLVLPRCDMCATVIWYPRAFCPACGSSSVSWIDAAGTGYVYSCTVVRKGQGAYREAAPYVVAYVELDEGPRMMTNVVDCDPDAVAIGMRVEVTFDATDKGTALPRFRPVGS